MTLHPLPGERLDEFIERTLMEPIWRSRDASRRHKKRCNDFYFLGIGTRPSSEYFEPSYVFSPYVPR